MLVFFVCCVLRRDAAVDDGWMDGWWVGGVGGRLLLTYLKTLAGRNVLTLARDEINGSGREEFLLDTALLVCGPGLELECEAGGHGGGGGWCSSIAGGLAFGESGRVDV